MSVSMPAPSFALVTLARALRLAVVGCVLLIATLLGLTATARAAGEPLAVEEAFRLSARVLDGRATLRFDIAPGYYLYRERFEFRSASAGLNLAPPQLPAGKRKHDEVFGEVEVYFDQLEVPLASTPPAAPYAITVRFQGCQAEGICYPPSEQTLNFSGAAVETVQPAATGGGWLGGIGAGLGSGALGTTAADVPAAAPARTEDAAAPETAAATTAATPADEAGQIAGQIADRGWATMIASFFGFGLLLCFTPCVLPMLPILSGIIVGHGAQISRGRALMLSGSYVQGMALTYTAAGVAAGLTGTLLSGLLQNVWVLGGFALVFVVLALAMFGTYELQLPTALQSRLSDAANRRGGSPAALFAMGVLSALIVGPCVAAPLAGALLYIANAGDPLRGGVALYALALGMGAPLMVAGVAARHWLPQPGPWMEGIKRFFGVVLLATAVWIASPVLPPALPLLAWGALLIGSAVFLHALDPLPTHARTISRLAKGFGVLCLLVGAALVLGALAGARDPLQPLAGLRAQAASTPAALAFEPVRSPAELDAALARARAAGRPVMLDYYADWCVSCHEMERDTFSHPTVQARLADHVLIQADVTAGDAEARALLARHGLFGPPGILFFDAAGAPVPGVRVTGFQPPAAFLSTLSALPQGPRT